MYEYSTVQLTCVFLVKGWFNRLGFGLGHAALPQNTAIAKAWNGSVGPSSLTGHGKLTIVLLVVVRTARLDVYTELTHIT